MTRRTNTISCHFSFLRFPMAMAYLNSAFIWSQGRRFQGEFESKKNWFIFYFLPIIHNSPNSILAHEQKSCCEGRKVYSNKSARKKFAYSLIMVRSCVRFLRIFNDAFYGRNSSQQATKKYKFMSVEVLP